MRVLLIVNATLTDTTRRRIPPGASPRKDYLVLQQALDADIVDLSMLNQRLWTRLVRRIAGASAAQALLAWARLGEYDAVFADRETTGFALAALLKLRRRRPRLTLIGHLISSPKKQILVRMLGLRTTIDCLVTHSSAQQRIAEESLGLRPEQVALVPYQVDERFWRPSNAVGKNQICSVGLEYRDYDTLMHAVDGLDVDVVIAAASHWSKHRAPQETPPRVRVASFDYEALRQLYAESRFVIVPLHDVDNQAGITVILEAMAMGKALVVSHTRGQVDVIRDRRSKSRAAPERATQPDWPRLLGASPIIAEGQTGIYVTPGNSEELRKAIVFLMQHPEFAQEMGANGRRLIEATMTLDHFTQRFSALITGRDEHGHSSVPHAGLQASEG